jgi:alkylation response protein AidB-like acyl-CoA dehydrogenase
VYVAASPAQRDEILGLVRGGARSSMLLTEMEPASNLLENQARAEPGRLDAAGAFHPCEPAECTHYRLTGEKQMINGGQEHDLMLMLLRTAPPGAPAGPLEGRRALSMFWARRQPGLEGTARWLTHPGHAADISGVRLDGVVVPASQRLGEEGDGFSIVQRTLSMSRGGIAALAAGTLGRARELAFTYAARREVYGQPIQDLGGIALHLQRLDSLERVTTAVALKAAVQANAFGLRASYHTCVAKLVACELAEEGVEQGARVVSARALLRALPYERLLRDVRLYGVFDGTSHVMLEELQFHLARAARRWARRAGDTPSARRAVLDGLRQAGSASPNELYSLLGESEKPDLPSLPICASALASLPGEVDLAPLVQLSRAVYELVSKLQAAGRWKADQSVRFRAARALGLTEALLALVEMCDLPRREALGHPPAQATEAEAERDRVGYPLALGWLGARVCGQLSELAHEADLEGWESLELYGEGGLVGIQRRLLAGHHELRATWRATLSV